MSAVNYRSIMGQVPDGWKVVSGANAPRGYRLINNNKSRFGSEYRSALVPEEVAYEWWCNRAGQTDGEGAE